MTLILMIGAAVAGAWLGSGIVASWPKRKVQIGMGSALVVAAILFAWRNLVESGVLSGAEAALVTGGAGTGSLVFGREAGVGLAGEFMLGALMTLGIGLMRQVYSSRPARQNAKAAFPTRWVPVPDADLVLRRSLKGA
jgi:hypothetical protein